MKVRKRIWMNYIKVASGKFLKTEFLKSDMFYESKK